MCVRPLVQEFTVTSSGLESLVRSSCKVNVSNHSNQVNTNSLIQKRN
jgi:hypothetical protein